jgi:hypothetical protein
MRRVTEFFQKNQFFRTSGNVPLFNCICYVIASQLYEQFKDIICIRRIFKLARKIN